MLLFSVYSGSVYATNNKNKQLPQGLQIKADRVGSLTPGWQRKLVKGEVPETFIYNHNEVVIPLDTKGLLRGNICWRLTRRLITLDIMV